MVNENKIYSIEIIKFCAKSELDHESDFETIAMIIQNISQKLPPGTLC